MSRIWEMLESVTGITSYSLFANQRHYVDTKSIAKCTVKFWLNAFPPLQCEPVRPVCADSVVPPETPR